MSIQKVVYMYVYIYIYLHIIYCIDTYIIYIQNVHVMNNSHSCTSELDL